jgi:hypothetical protein
MAVRSPSGKTFPENFTIIPSAKKWVFHAIYRLAFLSLYGEHICLLNRLVIRDEEDAEYHCSFETLILTHEMFRSSTVMLCTFHTIWQPFKRDIYNLLPSKKSQNRKLIEFIEVGRAWGEYTWYTIVFMILYHKTYLFFYDQKQYIFMGYSNIRLVCTELRLNMTEQI